MWERLQQDYRRLFGAAWPVWTGGALYGLVNILLFLHYKPWSTLDGVLNWGDNLFGGFGVGNPGALSPLLRSGSVINFGVVAGALTGALLAGQFGLRLAPRRELIKAAVGGVLMGVGAVLARGCNIGGFLSGWSAFSLHGLTMAAGLAVGAFLGARYLAWELERTSLDAGGGRRRSWLHASGPQPWVGLALLVGLLIAAFAYLKTGYDDRAVILLFGAVLGVVSQRSRICFVRAFREPFLTGDGGHARAVLLALLISAVGFAVVKYAIFERAEEFVRPTFWLGSLLGGSIFGLGMVLAGGCGGGTLWRIGEGQIQLVVALVGYVVAAAFANDYLVDNDLISKLGKAAFLPDMVGWPWALAIMLGIVALAYLVVQWADATGRLAALD